MKDTAPTKGTSFRTEATTEPQFSVICNRTQAPYLIKSSDPMNYKKYPNFRG